MGKERDERRTGMRALSDKTLLECALVSERNYFELAANIRSGDNYFFATIPGLETLPGAAACILDSEKLISRKQSDAIITNTISEVEDAFKCAGATTARIYINETEEKNPSDEREGLPSAGRTHSRL